jgi:hypothetical protein
VDSVPKTNSLRLLLLWEHVDWLFVYTL